MTTSKQVETLIKELERVQSEGEKLDCISDAYIKLINAVLKSMRVRLARGEWK